jgi:MoaA/NifB/PqqE/SkfB family radical SAM enzyme
MFSVCWNLTNVCNKNCEYCFRELNEDAQLFETNKGVLKNLKMMDVTHITFSGGEPFLYPNILDLIKLVHDSGIKVQIITNGSMLNKDNIEEYLQYVDRISFSCDSPRSYVNEQIGRGYDSYEHIKEILPYIREKFDSRKLKININSVITKDESKEYEEIKYMLSALKKEIIQYEIDKWKILRFYPLRCKAKDNEEIFWIPDDQFAQIKSRYTSSGPMLTVEVRDIKDFDEDLIVSPCGFLKKSTNGKEEVLFDLKPYSTKKGRI